MGKEEETRGGETDECALDRREGRRCWVEEGEREKRRYSTEGRGKEETIKN